MRIGRITTSNDIRFVREMAGLVSTRPRGVVALAHEIGIGWTTLNAWSTENHLINLSAVYRVSGTLRSVGISEEALEELRAEDFIPLEADTPVGFRALATELQRFVRLHGWLNTAKLLDISASLLRQWSQGEIKGPGKLRRSSASLIRQGISQKAVTAALDAATAIRAAKTGIRAPEAVALRREGLTLEEAGRRMNLTRERVRQLLLRSPVVLSCTVEGCRNIRSTRGPVRLYCKEHRPVTPRPTIPDRHQGRILDVLAAYHEMTEERDGHLLWMGTLRHGTPWHGPRSYGPGMLTTSPRRIAWWLAHGQVPLVGQTKYVPTCGDARCLSHLAPKIVTNRHPPVRKPTTECLRGHPWTPETTWYGKVGRTCRICQSARKRGAMTPIVRVIPHEPRVLLEQTCRDIEAVMDGRPEGVTTQEILNIVGHDSIWVRRRLTHLRMIGRVEKVGYRYRRLSGPGEAS